MTIAYILATLILIGAVVIWQRPGTFRTTRSITIAAPPAVIFPHINNLRQFNAWNPWARIDPNSQSFFEGPHEGVGAKMSWRGGPQVGEGSMTNISTRPYELIQFRMDFLKPFQATNTAEFTFQPEGSQTRVTWSMYGKVNLMGKLINLVIDCDKMIGDQFAQGLATLKERIETGAA